MKFTIELDLKHVESTGRDDPERVADCGYFQLLDGKTIHAGADKVAKYEIVGYSIKDEQPETDADGNELDVLPGDDHVTSTGDSLGDLRKRSAAAVNDLGHQTGDYPGARPFA